MILFHSCLLAPCFRIEDAHLVSSLLDLAPVVPIKNFTHWSVWPHRSFPHCQSEILLNFRPEKTAVWAHSHFSFTALTDLHDELIVIHLDGILTVAAGSLDGLNIKCLMLRFPTVILLDSLKERDKLPDMKREIILTDWTRFISQESNDNPLKKFFFPVMLITLSNSFFSVPFFFFFLNNVFSCCFSDMQPPSNSRWAHIF